MGREQIVTGLRSFQTLEFARYYYLSQTNNTIRVCKELPFHAP